MRLFVAVTLDAGIREEVGAVIRELRRERVFESMSIKWVETTNLHLTLQFLGEVNSGRVEDIAATLNQAWRQGLFYASLVDAGTFPPAGSPWVVWLSVGEGGAELRALHEEIQERLEPLGFAPEHRTYCAHLTIGRVRQVREPSGARMREAQQAVVVSSARWLVDRVVLYESRLSSAGSSYQVVTEARLHNRR